jgi:hypothetical protein
LTKYTTPQTNGNDEQPKGCQDAPKENLEKQRLLRIPSEINHHRRNRRRAKDHRQADVLDWDKARSDSMILNAATWQGSGSRCVSSASLGMRSKFTDAVIEESCGVKWNI